ncbi:LOW QUALITY PROTEIN: neurotrimin-like isoform X2, partial [Vespula squamosa]
MIVRKKTSVRKKKENNRIYSKLPLRNFRNTAIVAPLADLTGILFYRHINYELAVVGYVNVNKNKPLIVFDDYRISSPWYIDETLLQSSVRVAKIKMSRERSKSVHHRRGFRPTSTSTYVIFNQLRIIHPRFRPKSRTSVLEPSQNFLSSKSFFKSLRSLDHVEDERSDATDRLVAFVGLRMQQPPRGETWVGSTRNIYYVMQVLPGEWLLILVTLQNIFFLIMFEHIKCYWFIFNKNQGDWPISFAPPTANPLYALIGCWILPSPFDDSYSEPRKDQESIILLCVNVNCYEMWLF